MSRREFGVEYSNGAVAGGYTEQAARAAVKERSGKGWTPAATRAVSRTVGDWEPLAELRDGPHDQTGHAA